jgi:hypothetical protein
MRIQTLIQAVLLFPGFAVYAWTAELKMSLKALETGSGYETTVRFYAPGTVVSGMQLEFEYDPAVTGIQSVQPAEPLAAQDKQLWTSEPEPGVLRVLVIGINQYPLLNNAIVRITFTAENGAGAIRLRAATATSPDGDAIGLSSQIETNAEEGSSSGLSMRGRNSPGAPR